MAALDHKCIQILSSVNCGHHPKNIFAISKKTFATKKNVKKRKICLPPPICTFQFLFLHSSMSFGYFSQLVCVLDIESVFTRDSFEPAFPFSPPTHPPSQFPQYFERKQAHHRWKLFEQPENRNSNHSRQSRSWWK